MRVDTQHFWACSHARARAHQKQRFPEGFSGGSMTQHSCSGEGFENQCNPANWNSTVNTTDPTCGALCPMPPVARPAGAPAPIGAVLVSLTVAGFVVYCAVGAFLMHKRGETGKNLVPHREFWSELPGLVKEGVRFTFGGVVQKVREVKGFQSYENL